MFETTIDPLSLKKTDVVQVGAESYSKFAAIGQAKGVYSAFVKTRKESVVLKV